MLVYYIRTQHVNLYSPNKYFYKFLDLNKTLSLIEECFMAINYEKLQWLRFETFPL